LNSTSGRKPLPPRFVAELATRTSRYAKAGLHLGAEYAGRGSKFFHLAKFALGWRIVALSWIDDPA